MKYKTLGFTLHRACNASCEMCCFESNPHCTEQLDVSRIKEYIYESREIKDIESISFTGGEPFLDYEKLCDLVSFTKNCKKEAACISNAFWATSYEKAHDMIFNLKNLGLSRMSISHDAYHNKYVPTQNVRNALYVLRDLSVPATIGVARIKDEQIGGIVDEIGEALYSVNLRVFPCYPSGGALKAFDDTQFDRTFKSEHIRCIYDGNIVVSYDGTVYPCCSQMVIETGLGIGNFTNISLKEALQKIKNNSLLYFLRNTEMDFLMEYAKNNLNIKIPEQVTNPCEICGILFAKENLNKFLPFIMDNMSKVISKSS